MRLKIFEIILIKNEIKDIRNFFAIYDEVIKN